MQETSTSLASAVEETEDRFFAALRGNDADQVDQHLDDGFLIVDVNSGAVTDRAGLLAALRDGALAFDRVDLVERATRIYGDAGVVVGRTAMAGTFAGQQFAVASRYTHVFVRGADERWRLASGQGTPILDA